MILRSREAGQSELEKFLWIAVGVGTIVYNGENYIKAMR